MNKHIKLFEDFTPKEENTENIEIQIYGVPYDVKQDGNEFTMENCFGMEAIDILKRINSHGEQYGEFQEYFGVDVEKEKITITLFEKILELHEGDKIEALIEAVDVIETYYNDIGWEFLSDKKY